MVLKIVYYFVVVFFGFLFYNRDCTKNRRIYIVICSLTLLLGPTLRSVYYGVLESSLDTYIYYTLFHDIGNYSLNDIYQSALIRYFGNGGDEFDIGYLALVKFIRLFTDNFHVYTFISLLLFFVPFGILLDRYARSVVSIAFAYIFYIGWISIYAMGGARQLFAIGASIIVFLLLDRNKKLLASFVFVFGLTLHFSMLIIIVPFLLSFLSPKYLKTITIFSFFLLPIVFLLPNQIVASMGEFIGVSKYASYAGKAAFWSSGFFLIILEGYVLYCLYGIKITSIGSIISKYLYAMLPCIVLFGPLINVDGAMIRLTLYFFVFLTVLVPFATTELFSSKDGDIILITICSILIFLGLKGSHIPYDFYWNVDLPYLWK